MSCCCGSLLSHHLSFTSTSTLWNSQLACSKLEILTVLKGEGGLCMPFIHASVLGPLQRLNFGQLVDEISLFSNRSIALDTNRTHDVSGIFSTSSRDRFGNVHIWKEASQSESILSSIFLNGAKLMLALCLTMKNMRRSIMSSRITFRELLVLNNPCSALKNLHSEERN